MDGEKKDAGITRPEALHVAAGFPRRSGAIRRLVDAIVVLGALITGAVGVLSLVAPATFLAVIGHRGAHVTASTQIFASYTGARELAIAVALVILLALRSTRVLPGLMVVTAGANILDVADALVNGRWAQVPGAFVFALAFLAAAAWLFKQPHGHEAAI
jgi:hypothetical protein